MKKTLFALTLAGLSILGFSTAGAQYYNTGNYYYDGSYMNSMMYSNHPSNYYYSHPQNYGNYYGGSYGGGIGSYTIGCTTYYYDTRTRTQLYTQYICNNYSYSNYYYPSQYSYPSQYYYYTTPSYYTYPYYGGNYGGNTYCTYGYMSGAWYPSCGY